MATVAPTTWSRCISERTTESVKVSMSSALIGVASVRCGPWRMAGPGARGFCVSEVGGAEVGAGGGATTGVAGLATTGVGVTAEAGAGLVAGGVTGAGTGGLA